MKNRWSMNTKKTLKEVVVEGIYHDIEEGIYKPNDIITESEIIAKFSMSKSPVREALIELCKDDVLNSIPRVGYQVRAISLKEILDLLEFRVDVETANIIRLSQRITKEQLEELSQLDTIQKFQNERNVSPHWNRNKDFHLKLCEMGGNTYLTGVVADALRKSSQYISQYFYTAWKKDVESNSYYHKKVLDALTDGDRDGAVQMLQKDILNVREQIQENYSF